MDIFEELADEPSPFDESDREYDRTFILYDAKEDRSADRSSKHTLTKLGKLQGAEPQLVQRVTTNLLSVGDGGELALQQAAFKILTDDTDLIPEKGNVALDEKTSKHYRVIAIYRQGKKFDLMVTEYDD